MRWVSSTEGSAGDGINSLRRVRDVSNEIALLDSNNTALLTLLRKLRKKKSTDPRFEWFEDTFPTQTVVLASTAGTTSDATTLTLSAANAALGRPGDLWLNSDSGEIVYITANASSTEWTVIRGVGGTTVADIVAADNLFYIGNGQEQGEQARAQLTTQTSRVYNYCQIFKEPYEVTNTAAATKLYGGPDLVYLRQKHGQHHNRDIERALWFGIRDEIASTQGGATIDRDVFLSRGVIADGTNGFLTTNTSAGDTSSEYTEDEFETDLQTAFRYGNAVKFCFASPTAVSTINGWGREGLRAVPRENTWGVNITRYVSAHGELNIINNKLFGDMVGSGSTWLSGLNYTECAVILDLECCWYRYLRDTVLEMNIQENDRDSTEEQYLTECGLMLKEEKKHMDIYGFRQG